jgi:hypothetical protein
MTAPDGVQIDTIWTPKRGKGRAALPDLRIKQIHRPDRMVTVFEINESGTRRVMKWRELLRDYRPCRTTR